MITEGVREFLQQPRFAVVATINSDGSPQQTVLWFVLEDNTIVMNTTANRQKTRNLERDPRVSICVPDGYRYVVLSGRAELVENREQSQKDIEHLAIRYLGEQTGRARIAEFSQQQRVSIRVPIERVHAYGI